MNERKYESTFIPCGDALEKMELFADEVSKTEATGENIREIEAGILKDND